MLDIPVPHERLLMFIDKLNLDDRDMEKMRSFASVFAKKKEAFACHFYEAFLDIAETRLILDRLEHPESMKRIWEHWFENLFTRGLDQEFHAYLWRVGLRHVEVNLDQRFSNIGFSLVRQFCHDIIMAEIPEGERHALSMITDKLIDLCILIETSAFIEATTRCDLEVIRGIADKVRNPVTIIGGNVKRLQRKTEPGNPAYEVYDDLMVQTARLEQMVLDIKTYNEIFGREPKYTFVHPEAPVRTALERLSPRIDSLNIKIEMDFAPSLFMKADRQDMDQLFYYILQNGIDAADRENPLIRITASAEGTSPQNVRIEIFNTGKPPKDEDIDKFFSPFYSTKTQGTGFGLPIAQLAVKRSFGRMSIEPVNDKGTKVILTFPASE